MAPDVVVLFLVLFLDLASRGAAIQTDRITLQVRSRGLRVKDVDYNGTKLAVDSNGQLLDVTKDAKAARDGKGVKTKDAKAARVGKGAKSKDAKAAPTPSPTSAEKACSKHTVMTDCMQSNCGWTGSHKSGYCVSCDSASLEACGKGVHSGLMGCAWTGSKCRATTYIYLGGDKHSSFQADRYRPEETRAELCNEGNCGECDKPEECWQGHEQSDMKVKIPSNSPGERRFTSWTKCFTTEGHLMIALFPSNHVKNGLLTVWLNGNKVFHATETTSDLTKQMALPVGDLKIVVSFIPKDITKSSQAQVRIYLGEQDPYADYCLAHKFCLDKWGDGSRGSFRLRNENGKQRDCLQGLPMPPEMQPQCEAWKACLAMRGSKDFEESLIHMADAAFNGATETETVTAPDSCVDPRIADAEVFGCECLNELKSQCGATSDQTTCYKDLFCGHCKVCFKWKQEHCSSTQVADHQANCAQLLQPDATANETALLQRSAGHRTAAHATAAQASSSTDRDHKLDATVSAKCHD